MLLFVLILTSKKHLNCLEMRKIKRRSFSGNIRDSTQKYTNECSFLNKMVAEVLKVVFRWLKNQKKLKKMEKICQKGLTMVKSGCIIRSYKIFIHSSG